MLDEHGRWSQHFTRQDRREGLGAGVLLGIHQAYIDLDSYHFAHSNIDECTATIFMAIQTGSVAAKRPIHGAMSFTFDPHTKSCRDFSRLSCEIRMKITWYCSILAILLDLPVEIVHAQTRQNME